MGYTDSLIILINIVFVIIMIVILGYNLYYLYITFRDKEYLWFAIIFMFPLIGILIYHYYKYFHRK
jgi:ABC-type multidrug transport system permease subunit